MSRKATRIKKRQAYCEKLAQRYGSEICNHILYFRGNGASNAEIAKLLNDDGYKTIRGFKFTGATVSNILIGLGKRTYNRDEAPVVNHTMPTKDNNDYNISGVDMILKLLN